MATSGSYTSFAPTRNDIIKAAARKVGAIAAGETPDDGTIQDFSDALNVMVKHWQATGTYIWRRSEATLFLQKAQTQYSLNTSAADHATESFVETTLAADAASGAATITITSASGMSASDYLGIELDSGSWQFTTISGAPSTTLTPAAALTGAATSGNRVIAYTTKIVRPLRIIDARRYNFDSDIETPLMEYEREEYFDLPNKTNSGSVTGYYYDRRGGANANGLFYAWQSPSDVNDAVKFTYLRPIQDFAASGNTPDLPEEWTQALIFNLALVMAPEYDVPVARFEMIGKMALKYLADVQWWEREDETVSFVPDFLRR